MLLSIPYGSELKYTKLLNGKARIVYALFGEDYPGHRVRFYINRRCLERYAEGGNLKVLEIGSNNGAFSFWLSRNPRFRVVGLENEEKYVVDCERIARRLERENIRFICADAAKEPIAEDPFDLIFTSHVLEHIKDDTIVLANAFRLTKYGGHLIIQVPYGNPDKAPSCADLAKGHVREGYSVDDICKKVRTAGFEIISAGGSVGRIGRFAYRLGIKLLDLHLLVHFGILLLPLVHFLIYCEDLMARVRKRDPLPQSGILVVARRPDHKREA
ncbi:MAG: class I SAM-dependent methyltransferase [Proteobacteria bacterium]|nr:class I SAM-dependent methyltransferase [Pseudomonadota bacterium]